MIRLTRINRKEVVLNPDLIESVEETPDTTITLTSGERILVLERIEEIVEQVIEYRRAILSAFAVDSVHATTRGASTRTSR